MYTDVHPDIKSGQVMNTSIVSITNLRKNLFKIANMVVSSGKEVEVEKEGQRIMKLVKITDDPKERAKRLAKLLPKLGGMWKDKPQRELDELNEFFRGKKEKEYMKSLGKWSIKKRKS